MVCLNSENPLNVGVKRTVDYFWSVSKIFAKGKVEDVACVCVCVCVCVCPVNTIHPFIS